MIKKQKYFSKNGIELSPENLLLLKMVDMTDLPQVNTERMMDWLHSEVLRTMGVTNETNN